MTKPSGSSRSSGVLPLRIAWRAKTTSEEKSPAPMRMHRKPDLVMRSRRMLTATKATTAVSSTPKTTSTTSNVFESRKLGGAGRPRCCPRSARAPPRWTAARRAARRAAAGAAAAEGATEAATAELVETGAAEVTAAGGREGATTAAGGDGGAAAPAGGARGQWRRRRIAAQSPLAKWCSRTAPHPLLLHERASTVTTTAHGTPNCAWLVAPARISSVSRSVPPPPPPPPPLSVPSPPSMPSAACRAVAPQFDAVVRRPHGGARVDEVVGHRHQHQERRAAAHIKQSVEARRRVGTPSSGPGWRRGWRRGRGGAAGGDGGGERGAAARRGAAATAPTASSAGAATVGAAPPPPLESLEPFGSWRWCGRRWRRRALAWLAAVRVGGGFAAASPVARGHRHHVGHRAAHARRLGVGVLPLRAVCGAQVARRLVLAALASRAAVEHERVKVGWPRRSVGRAADGEHERQQPIRRGGARVGGHEQVGRLARHAQWERRRRRRRWGAGGGGSGAAARAAREAAAPAPARRGGGARRTAAALEAGCAAVEVRAARPDAHSAELGAHSGSALALVASLHPSCALRLASTVYARPQESRTSSTTAWLPSASSDLIVSSTLDEPCSTI